MDLIKNVHIIIWGKDYMLPVEYDCYAGENVTKAQKKALQVFLSHNEWLENAKESLNYYCEEHVVIDKDISKNETILNYVVPRYLYIKRKDKSAMVSLMCDYKYDIEHGIAISFFPTGKVFVDTQDSVL